MIPSTDRSAVESTATATTLPRPPASDRRQRGEAERREAPAWVKARVMRSVPVGVLCVVLGILIGAMLPSAAIPAATRPHGGELSRRATGDRPWIQDLTGAERAERVIAAVLAAAPECTPEIRMAGAPAAERGEFIEDAERLATEASGEQGLTSVRWHLTERDGRLFGVLYGERCD